MERLICRLHNYLEEGKYWRFGAVYKTEYGRSLVVFDRLEAKIDFFFIGKVVSSLFNILIHEIGNIHAELKYNPEDYEEMLACSCGVCSTSIDPYMFKKNVLRKFLNKGKTIIACQESTESVKIQELLSGYRLEKSRKQLIRPFVKAFAKFQTRHMAVRKLDENQRNSYLADILRPSIREFNFVPFEQAQRGKSETGIKEGEIDFTIDDIEGNQVTFFEGFTLNNLNKSNIIRHLKKSLLNYDAIGLDEKFVGVYCEAQNFLRLSNKYLMFIKSFKIEGVTILQTEDVSNIYTIGTEMKIFKTTYKRHSKQLILYSILVNLYLI